MSGVLGEKETLKLEDDKVQYIGNFFKDNIESRFTDLIVTTRLQIADLSESRLRGTNLTIPFPMTNFEIASTVAVAAKQKHRIRKMNREKFTN